MIMALNTRRRPAMLALLDSKWSSSTTSPVTAQYDHHHLNMGAAMQAPQSPIPANFMPTAFQFFFTFAACPQHHDVAVLYPLESVPGNPVSKALAELYLHVFRRSEGVEKSLQTPLLGARQGNSQEAERQNPGCVHHAKPGAAIPTLLYAPRRGL